MAPPIGHNESPTWTSLGVRIRQLRKARGWSQLELSLQMGGVHWQTVSRVELGHHTPSADFLGAMALAFGFEDMGSFLEGVIPGDLMR